MTGSASSTLLPESPPTSDPLDRVPVRVTDVRPRFTLDGDDALESHLAQTCDRIAAGLRGLLPERAIAAVLLGGGYGRGEGGVWRTESGDRPYNDLEFYVFLRGNRHLNQRLYGRALHVFGEILTPQAGMDVEFRIASLPELAGSKVSMFSYDLLSGHRLILGDDTALGPCAYHHEAEAIPLDEATRLLMNRCSGLLFAQQRLGKSTFTPGDADFVARNIAKAQLGAGDAVLTALGQYHWSVRERHRRVERVARSEHIPWLAEIARQHQLGTAFKLHPIRSNVCREELVTPHATISALCHDVWLWLESRRLGAIFHTVRDYVESNRSKAPGTTNLRNVLVNAKVFGASTWRRGNPFRHPRDRILTTLPLLLWEHDALATPATLARVQRELGTTAADFPRVVEAYRSLWAQVN